MIFIVNQNPFAALQLQNQLLNTNDQFVEVYLSAEETEQNLYKLPEVVLLDENIEIGNLLYLTQSIKAYDPSIQAVWLCTESSSELKKIYPSYGVMQCITKGDYFLERLSLTIIEARKNLNRSNYRQNRIEHLRNNILDMVEERDQEQPKVFNFKFSHHNRNQ